MNDTIDTGSLSNDENNYHQFLSSNISFFQQLELPVQQFTISPYQKNTITGKRGLKVHIEANAFVYMNGIPVFEPVDIELKEVYSKSEIVRENLNTISNGKVREWGAMVYFNATSNGENVTLQNGLPITIELPRSQNPCLKGMRIYNGQRIGSKQINWLENDYTSLHRIGIVDKINPMLTMKMIKNSRSGKRLLGNYLFKTTRLGWINCNRGLDLNEEKTTLKVVEDTNALIDIKLVFKKKKIVIPLQKDNGHFSAFGVPVGEKAFLVGLGQINDELYMAVKEITINKDQKESLEFKMMTPGMIKKKLKVIN